MLHPARRLGERPSKETPMSSRPGRHPRNVAGAFYVDSQCTDCSLCQETAPTVFRRDNDTCESYVAAQPRTPEELRLAVQAARECPDDAIGWDGVPASPALRDCLKEAGIPGFLATSRQPATAAFGAINTLMGLAACWFAFASIGRGEELPSASRIRAALALFMGVGYIGSGCLLIAGWKFGKVLTILFGLLSLLVLIPIGFGTASELGWSWGSLIPFGLAVYWIAGGVLLFRSRGQSSSRA